LGCEVWFYQLERSPLAAALPALLEKTLARGWRAVVRTANDEDTARIDEMLWTYREDSFLPHGVAGERLADHQPILLTSSEDYQEGTNALFVLNGAEPSGLMHYERCVILFDGQVEGELASARAQWKKLKADGWDVSFWRENPDRGWEKQG
jgi:DNA polymerase-3 subunit chi